MSKQPEEPDTSSWFRTEVVKDASGGGGIGPVVLGVVFVWVVLLGVLFR